MTKIKETILIFLIKLWFKSIRIKKEYVIDENLILALWHQDLMASMLGFSDQNISVMISSSKDGDLATNIAKWLGFNVFRGSNSKQAESLRFLLRDLKKSPLYPGKPSKNNSEYNCVGMAMDGPKGPAKAIKKGTYWLYQNSNCPIAFINVSYSKYIQINSWDHSKIPLPGSKITLKLFKIKEIKSFGDLSKTIEQIS